MLLPRAEHSIDDMKCPVVLSGFLGKKDYCTYLGHYHTDVTLPSEYFRDDVQRPADLPAHHLDFTYLFEKSLENPDHILMGSGLQIQEDSEIGAHSAELRAAKRSRASASEIATANAPLLLEALSKG